MGSTKSCGNLDGNCKNLSDLEVIDSPNDIYHYGAYRVVLDIKEKKTPEIDGKKDNANKENTNIVTNIEDKLKQIEKPEYGVRIIPFNSTPNDKYFDPTPSEFNTYIASYSGFKTGHPQFGSFTGFGRSKDSIDGAYKIYVHNGTKGKWIANNNICDDEYNHINNTSLDPFIMTPKKAEELASFFPHRLSEQLFCRMSEDDVKVEGQNTAAYKFPRGKKTVNYILEKISAEIELREKNKVKNFSEFSEEELKKLEEHLEDSIKHFWQQTYSFWNHTIGTPTLGIIFATGTIFAILSYLKLREKRNTKEAPWKNIALILLINIDEARASLLIQNLTKKQPTKLWQVLELEEALCIRACSQELEKLKHGMQQPKE